MLFWLSLFNFYGIIDSNALKVTSPSEENHTGRLPFQVLGGIFPASSMNVPKGINVYDSVEIKVIIEDKPGKPRNDDDEGSGLYSSTLTVKKQLLKFVLADLTGPPDSIMIKAGGNPIQTVERNVSPSFIWYISPQTIGHIPIDLELYTRNSADQDSGSRVIPIFNGNIDVVGHGFNMLRYEITHLQPVQTAIISIFSCIGATLTFFGIKAVFARDKQKDFVT